MSSDIEFTIMRKDCEIMWICANGMKVESKFLTNNDFEKVLHFKPNREQLTTFLEMRCFERGKPNCKELLSYLGLEEYNPYDIVRKTHGVCPEDYVWLRFPGESLTWKDVNVHGRS